MKPKIKKILIVLITSISILIIAYVAFVGHLVTNGYRDYVGFCSNYIDQIEEYKSKTGNYPDSLRVLEKPLLSFRYDVAYCRYYSSSASYGFTTLCGLIGRSYYNSIDKKWVCDYTI